MKPIQVEHSNLLRTPVTSHFQRRAGNADTTKERTIADPVLIVALVAAILALYAAMFIGLYHWGHYDPLLPPDSATLSSSPTDALFPDAFSGDAVIRSPRAAVCPM
jgi:hypothetical protein